MRVDFTNFGQEPPEKTKTGRAGQSGTAAASSTASGGASAAGESTGGSDRTRFTFDQARVTSLETAVLQAPEVREEKVASLQQAIASGEYTVDSSQVADAIAADAANGRVR